jgi:hypothetical protein
MTCHIGEHAPQRATRPSGVRSRHVRLAVTCASILAAFSCAGARLDPDRNQALTFDTTPSDDAGVTPPAASEVPVRAAASQPSVAEDKTRTPDAPMSSEPITCTVDPPDPKPLHTRDWIIYDFSYDKGKAELRSQRRERTAKPRDTARVVGRYAVELWIGCELVDRVRFSFPLQGAEQPKAQGTRHALHEQPSLTANARLATTVWVPFSLRATRAELVDRGAGTRSTIAWPPDMSQKPASNSAEDVPATGSQ